MSAFNWQISHFFDVLLPAVLYIFGSEILIDCIKHAFVTRYHIVWYGMVWYGTLQREISANVSIQNKDAIGVAAENLLCIVWYCMVLYHNVMGKFTYDFILSMI